MYVNYCDIQECPDHIMVSPGGTSTSQPWYGLYSRIGSSLSNRPIYRRGVYSSYRLFYSKYAGAWAIKYIWSYSSYSWQDLEVSSIKEFALCPQHTTRFAEWERWGEKWEPIDISMKVATTTTTTTTTTSTPSQEAEMAAEWLESHEIALLMCSIFLPMFVPLVGYALRECCHMIQECSGSGAQADMHQTLVEIRELLESPEQQEFYVINPQGLKSLDPCVKETIAEKQKLFDYYRKRCGEKPSLCRAYSLYSNVFMWLFLSYVTFVNGCGVQTLLDEERSLAGSLLWYAVVIASICHLLVLLESCISREKDYLGNMGNMQQTKTAIDRMVALEPELSMTAVAWHTELRTRQVCRTDAQGNTVYSTETYTEPVVTAQKSEYIPIRYWRDLSVDDILLGVANEGITTLFVESLVCAGDVQSSEVIDRTFGQFKDKHRHLDAFVDFNLNYQVPGLQKRLTICRKPSPPWWANLRVFYLASLVGMTWIYRIGLKMTASTSFVLVKQVFVAEDDAGI
eukprot:Skav203897  [mRNA]  locus=scaffold1649:187091:188629:- [translate_table: standard]